MANDPNHVDPWSTEALVARGKVLLEVHAQLLPPKCELDLAVQVQDAIVAILVGYNAVARYGTNNWSAILNSVKARMAAGNPSGGRR